MIVLVNFGGPRNLEEVPIFLKTLLQDRDVIRTKFPTWLHNLLFGWIARKRAKTSCHDYALIGGKSPIYFDTEEIANRLREKLQRSVITFHRYLPSTHKASLEKIEASAEKLIHVLPLFPQFSYATTGSIARFFKNRLSSPTVERLSWIKSYPTHPAFIKAHKERIQTYLEQHDLSHEDTALLFSAHGLPRSFISLGDIYERECIASYQTIMQNFPHLLSKLSYQSKFGKGEWLRPYTDETCASALTWLEGRKNVVVIPLSFTSDHIETLFEIEKLYLPTLQEQEVKAYRCPALNLEPYWIDALCSIVQAASSTSTHELIPP